MNIKYIFIGFILLILLSGCVQPQKEAPTPIPTSAPTSGATPVTSPTVQITEAPTPQITPVPTLKELPPGTFYVIARMLTPSYWGPGKYELVSVKAEVTNQRNTPYTINAQILSDQQVLEEKSFTLANEGSTYALINERNHFINSTNVTLRLLVQGYQPIDYNFVAVQSLT